MQNIHQWKEQARGFARRASIGSIASLSLTLVAFEWTTPGSFRAEPDPLGDTELPWEVVPVVTVKPEKKQEKAIDVPLKKKDPSGPIQAIDAPVEPDLGTIDQADPAPIDVPSIDPIDAPSTAPDPGAMTLPVLNPEVLPHFEICQRSGTDRTKECTEQRILRHLERHLKIPDNMRGSVRTTVTFEIDVNGTIGRLHCAPKVDPQIEQEIERVIRSLPQFIRGSQGGHPVAVYYQIPLLLSRN